MFLGVLGRLRRACPASCAAGACAGRWLTETAGEKEKKVKEKFAISEIFSKIDDFLLKFTNFWENRCLFTFIRMRIFAVFAENRCLFTLIRMRIFAVFAKNRCLFTFIRMRIFAQKGGQ